MVGLGTHGALRRACAAALTLLIVTDIGRAVAADAAASRHDVQSMPSEATLEQMRFRAEVGLDASRATVEALAKSAGPSSILGIPLSGPEEAVMVERGRIQQELGPLREFRRANWHRWGGLWLSYPPDSTPDHAVLINVALTEIVQDDLGAISRLLPRGADLDLRRVANTQASLDELHAVVVGDEAFFQSIGTDLHLIATDLTRNVTEIDVSPLDTRIESAIVERYGSARVRVVESGPVSQDACTRTNCGPPWLAGLFIVRSPGGNACTSNFIVRQYAGVWNYATMTSGHCLNGTWKQGSTTGTTIGNTGANYFVAGSDADIQTIPFVAGGLDDYLAGPANCNPSCTKVDVRTKECKDCDEVGEIIKNNGAVSGTTSQGTVVNTNVTCPASDCDVILYRQRRATYPRQPGDSGGPVTALSAGAYDVAAGSHTDFQTISGVQYAIYSHIAEIEEKTGWAVWVNQ